MVYKYQGARVPRNRARSTEMQTLPTLWYFADPMCSWCFGFAPVIARLREEFADRLRVALVLGGLRPGTAEPLTAAGREETLQHWREVQQMTGQTFAIEGALPAGFVYDTEPACRAVVTVGDLAPARILAYFGALQSAFYEQGRDITRMAVLADLAVTAGLDRAVFEARFDTEAMKDRTWLHFRQTREAGVRGFPTLIWQHGEQVRVCARGIRRTRPWRAPWRKSSRRFRCSSCRARPGRRRHFAHHAFDLRIRRRAGAVCDGASQAPARVAGLRASTSHRVTDWRSIRSLITARLAW